MAPRSCRGSSARSSLRRSSLNAFSASFNPAEHAKSGPLRWLPVEMTLLNTLPITTRQDRVRVLFGTNPRFQIYFLDDNAFAA